MAAKIKQQTTPEETLDDQDIPRYTWKIFIDIYISLQIRVTITIEITFADKKKEKLNTLKKKKRGIQLLIRLLKRKILIHPKYLLTICINEYIELR